MALVLPIREREQSLCQMALRVDRIANITTADPSQQQQQECSPNYFCISSSLIFAGSILLCVLGFTVVLPYEATSDWPEVTCRVVDVEYNASICACRNQPTIYENCHGKNPCLRVTVSFSPSHLQANNSTGSCASSVAEGTSATPQSSFGFDDSISISTSGFSELPEAGLRRLVGAEKESTTSEDLHSSSADVTGLGLLSVIFERPRPTRDLTEAPAPTPSSLQQSTSAAIVRRKSESLINKSIHHDLEMELYFNYYTAATTNPIFMEARLFRSWYEAFYEEVRNI